MFPFFDFRPSVLLPGKFRFLAAVLVLLLVGDMASAAHQLANGDVEQVDSNDQIEFWSSHARTGNVSLNVDLQEKTQGKNAARFELLPPEGANFRADVGQLNSQAVDEPSDVIFSFDAKFTVPEGKKGTAYFRVYVGERLQIVKIPVSATWSSVKEKVTLQAGERITSLDLSGAGDAGTVLWLDNLQLGSPSKVPAAQGSWLLRQDINDDGFEDILLENPYYAVAISPEHGGSIISLRIKPSGHELALANEKLPVGLFNDVIGSGDHISPEKRQWNTQVDESSPGRVRIVLKRTCLQDAESEQAVITKTLEASYDSPAIDVTIDAGDSSGKPLNEPLRYAVKNQLSHVSLPTEFYMPGWRGVSRGEFIYGSTAGSQNQFVRFPPQGWSAVMVANGPGVAFESVRGNPTELYSWRKNHIATWEWKFGSEALGGSDGPVQYRLIAFAALPHVDGVMDGAAAAWVVSGTQAAGQPLEVKFLCDGVSKLRTIAMTWRRLPDGPWVDFGQHVIRSQPGSSLATLAATLPAMPPGTYVLRASMMVDDKVASVVERPVVLGEASGEFTMTATIKDVNPLGPAHSIGAIPIKPSHPVTITKRMPVVSRLVKGLAYAPFDGRSDTRSAGNSVEEWRGLSSLPVSYYTFSKDNGIHLTLDPSPFNVIQVRGDWKGSIYADSDALLPPPDSVPVLAQVEPKYDAWRHILNQPVTAHRLSFFYQPDTNGALADVSILLAEKGNSLAKDELEPLTFHASAMSEADGLMRATMLERYGKVDAVVALTEKKSDFMVAAPRGQFIHLLTPALDPTKGIAAVTVTLELEQIEPDSLLTLRLQDPLGPIRENMHVDFRVSGPGVYTITLDAPDMVILDEAAAAASHRPRLDGKLTMDALWLSLASSTAMTAKRMEVTLHLIPRSKALVEAKAWHMFLLQGMFSAMSENRPWMLLNGPMPTREEILTSPDVKIYRKGLMDIMTTVEVMRMLAPQDPIVLQYYDWLYQQIDRKQPLPVPTLPEDGDAPRWARLLRENWRLVSAIPKWWIENRMAPDGTFGGGINDDTDLLQTWQCLPMIEDAPLGKEIRQAGLDLADRAWEHTLEEGINRTSMDSLHAYEEGINQLSLNAWWFHGDPFHFERLMLCARSTLKLMMETPDGRVHFGTPMLGIEQARHGFDRPGVTQMFSSLFLHPLYEVAMYNRNPKVIDRMKAWGDTWASYQQPGAFVQQVDTLTGKPVKTYPYQRGPTDEWTAIWQVTGDERFLKPMIMGFKPGEYWGFQASYGDLPQAGIDWPEPTMTQIRSQFANGGYTGLLLGGNRQALEQSLEKSYAWYSKYPWMDTQAHQRTDRVFTYNASAFIASYLGAAPNRNRWVRMNAVSYEGMKGEEFAALVWDAGVNRLRVAIYNFNQEPLVGKIRLWRLEHGTYLLREGLDENDDGRIDSPGQGATVTLKPYDTLQVTLPGRKVTVLELTQTAKLDDIRQRADLALSSRTTNVGQDGIKGIVHNIGATSAQNVIIALIDSQGTEHARKALGDLEAPLDLSSRHLDFEFTLPAGSLKGWRLVVDPDQSTPEILEQNNTLQLSALRTDSRPSPNPEPQP